MTIPAASVATLADYEDRGAPLIDATTRPIRWTCGSRSRASNTVEGVQIVHVTGTYALHTAGGSPGWHAYDATIALPATTWTRGAAGPIALLVRAARVDRGDRGHRQLRDGSARRAGRDAVQRRAVRQRGPARRH